MTISVLPRSAREVRRAGGGQVSGVPRQPETASSATDALADLADIDVPAASKPAGEPAWALAARCFAGYLDGDRSALDEMVRALSPALWQVVRSYGLDRNTAEDVVQTTWLILLRSAESVKDAQAVWRWLTTTARREAWRLARQGGRTQPTEDLVLERALPTARSPELTVVDEDGDVRLWRHVSKLDQRCQRLLRVVAFDDRPDYATLSVRLGMPVGSIGPTRSRCLAKLRTLMTSEEGRRP